MRHTVNLCQPQFQTSDSVTFIGNAERVTMSINGFVEFVKMAGLQDKKIEMIKALRCLVYVSQNQYGEIQPDEVMSLKFAKDIVEWFTYTGFLNKY